MKHILPLGICLAVLAFLPACNSADPVEPDNTTDSGTIEFMDEGTHTFSIDKPNITAKITMVGGGGGGGGGIEFTNTNSTGGGGGGGAGQLLTHSDVAINQNAEYTVIIGGGGSGGTVNNLGLNGTKTEFKIGAIPIYEALPGSGGRSNTIGESVGGAGGDGYPAGAKGSDGQILDMTGHGFPGQGGQGGDNLSGYGNGGQGGNGALINNSTVTTSAKPGGNGGTGYFKIEWKSN
jgi:hypothetical protein